MSTDLKSELDAILHRAAIAPLTDRAFLRVTGSDATRWLNGMVTNSIQTLAPGEGCYNFLLNAQGRILGDCTIYREPGDPPTYLLETTTSQVESIQQHLDHFIIMDDVELTSPILAATGLLLLGPNASWPLVSAADSNLPALGGQVARVSLNGHEALILTPPYSAIPTYEVWFASVACTEHTFYTLGTGVEGVEVSPEALEALRILEGRPLCGRDITEKYLPQETNQTNALHFNKGCYLGQEIVERIRSRGQIHRLLTSLALTGSLPKELPTPIQVDGKPVGEITSAAVVPLPDGDQILALGYVRREALDAHQSLTYSGGTAAPRSLPKPLASNPTEPIHA